MRRVTEIWCYGRECRTITVVSQRKNSNIKGIELTWSRSPSVRTLYESFQIGELIHFVRTSVSSGDARKLSLEGLTRAGAFARLQSFRTRARKDGFKRVGFSSIL